MERNGFTHGIHTYSCCEAAGEIRAACGSLPILKCLDERGIGLHACALMSEIDYGIVQSHITIANEVCKDDSCTT